MKTLLLLAVAALSIPGPAAFAAVSGDAAALQASAADPSSDLAFERRGRGRGSDDRAGDDRRGDRGRDDRGGRRPRVPGGSGCDSPRDVREHPECRG